MNLGLEVPQSIADEMVRYVYVLLNFYSKCLMFPLVSYYGLRRYYLYSKMNDLGRAVIWERCVIGARDPVFMLKGL